MDWSREIRRRVTEDAIRAQRQARELAPLARGPLFSSITVTRTEEGAEKPVLPLPIFIDPVILADRGVIDVPGDVDSSSILDALREAAEKAIEAPAAPLVVTRSADGAPVVERVCQHPDEVEVDLIVTGEVVARLCLSCGRTAYAEGW